MGEGQPQAPSESTSACILVFGHNKLLKFDLKFLNCIYLQKSQSFTKVTASVRIVTELMGKAILYDNVYSDK